jgi:hypothetical protein
MKALFDPDAGKRATFEVIALTEGSVDGDIAVIKRMGFRKYFALGYSWPEVRQEGIGMDKEMEIPGKPDYYYYNYEALLSDLELPPTTPHDKIAFLGPLNSEQVRTLTDLARNVVTALPYIRNANTARHRLLQTFPAKKDPLSPVP